MMKFKKFLVAAMTGAMMFGSVAMAVPMVSVYAEDAVSAYTIEINYTDYTAKISSTTKADPYVILEVVKDSSGSKVSGTHAYEMKDGAQSITVDLSFLKAAKASYLRVRGSSETVTSKVVTVNGMPGKLSLKYTSGKIDAKKTDPAENVAAAFSGSKTSISVADLNSGLYEYHTLYGGEYWENLADLPQEMVEVAGTTIVVRKVADDSSADDKKAPASAEVKVKIPAAPKAPKVTVDYAKGTIKLPKSAQVRVAYTADQTAAAQAAEDTDTTTEPKLVLVSGKGKLWGKTSATGAKYEEVTNANITTYFTLEEDKKSFSVASGCTFASAVEDVLAFVSGKTLYKEESGNKVAVNAAALGDFFEIRDGAIVVKNNAAALYSANDAGTAIDWSTDGSKENPSDYVKVEQKPTAITEEASIKAYVEIDSGSTPPPSTSGSITDWLDNTLTAAASQEDILKLFTDTKDKATDLIKSGFTLFVRTKATDKKAASNPCITTFGRVVEATWPDKTKDEVKVGDATLTWKAVEKGIQYTGTGFEYWDTSKSKWVAIKSGSVTKATTSADINVKVRKAGVKATKTEAGVLPSLEVEITVKKYVDPSATGTPTPEAKSVDVTVANNGSASVQKPTGNTPAELQLVASVKDASGNALATQPTVTWSVKDGPVAGVTVGTTGKVSVTSAVTVTSVTIVATVSDTVKKEFPITITSGGSNPSDEEAASIDVAVANSGSSTVTKPSTDTIDVQLTATVKNSEGTALTNQPTVTWSLKTDPTTGVTVGAKDGKVTIASTAAAGNVIIVAKVSDAVKAEFTIKIQE